MLYGWTANFKYKLKQVDIQLSWVEFIKFSISFTIQMI